MARVYKVKVVLDDAAEVAREYLVEAENPAHARAHVTRNIVSVELATAQDVHALAKAGVEIENITNQETLV